MLPTRLRGWQRADRAPRPYVAFAAVDRKHARRLYRAQNLIWMWLGFAALLSMFAYFFRPALGPVFVTSSTTIDTLRSVLFGLGGLTIGFGIWCVRRVVEVWGHLLFSSGALITATAEAAGGLNWLSLALVFGVALVSGFRVWYIVSWIGAGASAESDVPSVRE